MSGDELAPEHWDRLAAESRRAATHTTDPEIIRYLLAQALVFEAKATELRKKRGDGSY